MPAERPNFIKTQQIAGQEAAIRKVVPDTFFRQAKKIVESRKPTDPRLKDLDVLNMAKVLVVEDDSIWAFIHKDLAQEFGHEVVEATSAETAKKAIDANSIDCVITDGLEGQWTQVHDIAKEKEIRTILVSADDKLEIEAKKRGVAFIDKLFADASLEDIYRDI